MNIGIIGGHTLAGLLQERQSVTVETPYGDVDLTVGSMKQHHIFFLQRHGVNEHLPPHKINYRANMMALSESHVDCVISLGTVGSLNPSMKPGELVIPHDFIDCTKARPLTFYDEDRIHVDMSQPFCPSLREILIERCQRGKVKVHDAGVYVTTEGPRLETAAEIAFYAKHADIVGMTLVPEVVLARERGLCYASLCLVCNMAAGLQKQLPADEIATIVHQRQGDLVTLLQDIIPALDHKKACSCAQSITKAKL